MRSLCAGNATSSTCSFEDAATFPWAKPARDDVETYWNETKFPDGERSTTMRTRRPARTCSRHSTRISSSVSGDPRAQRRLLRRLPHALRARRRDEGERPLGSYPLLNVNRACQTCHRFSEEEIKSRVDLIQSRNYGLLQRGGHAIVELIDAVVAAKAAGASAEQLAPALDMQRRAQWRLDFIAAENSMGFHAPQEAARVLGEAIDYARQGQIAALQTTGGAKPKPPANTAGQAGAPASTPTPAPAPAPAR